MAQPSDADIDSFLNEKPAAAQPNVQPSDADIDAFLGTQSAQAAAQTPREAENTAGRKSPIPGLDYFGNAQDRAYSGLLGLPGGIQRLAEEYGPESVSKFAKALPQLPTGSDIYEGLRKENVRAGLATGEPSSALGRLGQAALAGPMTALGPAGVGANTLANVGGQAASEVTDNPWAILGAGLLGGTAGAGTENAIRGAVERSAARGAYKSATEGLEKLGVPVSPAQGGKGVGQVAGEEFSQQQSSARTALQDEIKDRATQAQAELDAAKTKAGAEHDEAVAQAEQHAAENDQLSRQMIEDRAAKLGSSATPEAVGTNAQALAHNFAEGIPDLIEKSFSDADKLVDRDKTFVIPSGFEATANKIARETGPGQPIAQKFGQNAGQAVLQGLDQMKAMDAARQELGLPPQGPMTVRQAVALKGLIGEAQLGKGPLKDVGEKQLSQLYGSLNSDIRGAYAEISPEAADAYDNANKAAKDIYDFAGKKGPLSRIIASRSADGETKSPGAVGTALMNLGKTGGADLMALRERMPQLVDDVAAGVLRSDPDAWGKLKPEGKAALVTDPTQRTDLDMLQQLRDQSRDILQAKKGAAKQSKLGAIGEAQSAYDKTSAEIEASRRAQRDTLTQTENDRAMQIAKLKEQQAKNAELGGPKTDPTWQERFYRSALGALSGGGIGPELLSGITGEPIHLGSSLLSSALTGALMGGAAANAPSAALSAAKAGLSNPSGLLGATTQAVKGKRDGQ